MGCAEVADYPAGENAWGCRQLIGNVWEWTADTFNPFDGLRPTTTRNILNRLFGDTKVLRGGSWVTRSRYINAQIPELLSTPPAGYLCRVPHMRGNLILYEIVSY